MTSGGRFTWLFFAFLACTRLDAATVEQLVAQGEENLSLGYLASADSAFREALTAARASHDVRGEAAARNGIARAFVGNRWEDIGQARLALRIHRQLHDARGEASDLACIGEVYLVHGFVTRALPPLTEAVTVYSHLGTQSAEEARARENLGMALQAVGSYEEAVGQLTRAVDMTRRNAPDSFAVVRAETRLGTLQMNMGLDEAAAEHLKSALDAVSKLRTRFPGEKWAKVGDTWAEQGKKAMLGISTIGSEVGNLVAENPLALLSNEDSELLDEVAVVLNEEGSGGNIPDDFPKPPPMHASAEEIRHEWIEFIERQRRILAERDERGPANEMAKSLAEAAGGFNRDVQTQYHEPPPTKAFLQDQAKRINDILADNDLSAHVTPEMIAERSHPGPAPIDRAAKMRAGMFLGMMSRIQHSMLKAVEQGRKEMLKTFTPEEVRVVDTVMAAPPCQMQIASALQAINADHGNTRDAEAMRKLAWTLYDERNALLAKLSQTDIAENLLEQRRVARAAGMPVPATYTTACDGTLTFSKETLWDADVAAAAGHINEALGKYQEMVTTNPGLRAAALAKAGALYQQRGDHAKALETYARAIDAAESVQRNLRLDQLVMSWVGRSRPLYGAMIGLSFDQGHTDTAFSYAERARARAFLNQLGNRRLPSAAVPKELASELYDVRRTLFDLETFRMSTTSATPLGSPFGGDENRMHEEETARKRYQDLLGRVAQSNPAYLSLLQVDTVNLKQLQHDILPADTALIEYFILPDRLLIWVVDRGGMHAVASPISAARIADEVAQLRDLIVTRDAGAQAMAGRLYERLIAPVSLYIHSPNLIIVPHGVLHYLPFAALWSASRNHYLIEDYTLTLAPSASALRFTVKKHQREGTLVFGDPDRSLPNAATEAKAVAAIYGTTAWTGSDARESRLRRDSARAGIIHIAAHARYEEGRPLFTTINLAPDEGDAGRDEAGDGHLHVYEVFDLDLSSIQLAVLSACETSIGPASGGDDIVGLANGFRYAGASSVLATLWAINDASTTSFMTVFHSHVHGGVSAADALRQTQLQVIRQRESREPYYWAAYTLTR